MKIAVIDIETTAIKPEDGQIVEIGICELDLENGGINKLFEVLVKEHDFDSSVDAWIYHNSDLTPEEIEHNGIHPSEFKDELQEIFNGYLCAAFSQHFDFVWLEHRGWKIPNVGPDMMHVATDFFKVIKRKTTPTSSSIWVKYLSVQECLELFNIREEEKHRAYPDCVQEAKIYYELYKKGVINLY